MNLLGPKTLRFKFYHSQIYAFSSPKNFLLKIYK